MKKTYIMPATLVTKVAISHMLCLSGQLDKTQSITDPNGFGAHEDNSWDIWGNNDDFDE